MIDPEKQLLMVVRILDSHKFPNFCSKGFRKINKIWEDFNCGYHANNYLLLHCIALNLPAYDEDSYEYLLGKYKYE